MASTVDVDVSCDTVAAVAGEAILTVTLLRQTLISLNRQVIVGYPQLAVSRL